MREAGLERERDKAQSAYHEYKHVGVVNKVARASGNLGGERQRRLLVLILYVVNKLVFRVYMRIQVPLLLHAKLLRVYHTLILVA